MGFAWVILDATHSVVYIHKGSPCVYSSSRLTTQKTYFEWALVGISGITSIRRIHLMSDDIHHRILHHMICKFAFLLQDIRRIGICYNFHLCIGLSPGHNRNAYSILHHIRRMLDTSNNIQYHRFCN